MKKEEMDCCSDKRYVINKCHHGHHGQNNGAIYGLGVVGALFYFLQGTSTFVTVLMGIGKAIFWPAILMFKLLTYLKI